MLTKIYLERFKNFQSAELTLGQLTVLVGTNGSGKSNLKDAFRFLHGVSRGYNLAEIIGEKWFEFGSIQWHGLRGGTREITFCGASTFALEVSLNLGEEDQTQEVKYRIEVDPGKGGKPPRVVAECLNISQLQENLFTGETVVRDGKTELLVKFKEILDIEPNRQFNSDYPLLSQIAACTQHWAIQNTLKTLYSMRFLDFRPEVMRQPSFPGQKILGTHGENLSSVLQVICKSYQDKDILLDWLKKLTHIEPVDLEFTTDFQDKVLLTILEANGQKSSAYSLSDSTLRFLAILAEILGSQPHIFACFDPLESEIHPTRLHLLVELIEGIAPQKHIQILATTHSSQLLRLLSSQTIKFTSLTYRTEGQPAAKIQRIWDIPDSREVIEQQTLARLHESAWLENAMELLGYDEDNK